MLNINTITFHNVKEWSLKLPTDCSWYVLEYVQTDHVVVDWQAFRQQFGDAAPPASSI